jgi:hypothetical protein
MGFTFDEKVLDDGDEANPITLMKELIAKNSINASRFSPYIGGVRSLPCP